MSQGFKNRFSYGQALIGTGNIGDEFNIFFQNSKRKVLCINRLKSNRNELSSQGLLLGWLIHSVNDSKTGFFMVGHYLGPEI